jgi:hypothetical protein
MNSNYEVFKQRSDGSFVRIESVKNIDQAKTDFKKLVSAVPATIVYGIRLPTSSLTLAIVEAADEKGE